MPALVTIQIFAVPFAYCSVSSTGYCRYAEHLSISVGMMGDGLLQQHPELCGCDGAPQWGWEACHTSPGASPCITPIQTGRMNYVDPGFCKLARKCMDAAAAAHGED